MTARVVLLGLVLVPLQAFWTVHMELVRDGIFPSVLSLLFTVVFLLFVVCLANLAVRRVAPRLALRGDELLALYIVLAAGASLTGCDVGQTLVHLVGAPYRLATPENAWSLHFHRYLPSFLHLDDAAVLEGFYEGASSFYQWRITRFWLGPIANWMIFCGLMLLAMLATNVLVRRQWVEHERLTFPIVQVPLGMTLQPGFWSHRGLWWGFAVAASIDLVNGLNALVPWVPRIPCKQFILLGTLTSSKPWTAVGWWPVTAYPFAMGIGFLMPLEMNFSCWFGLLLWKAQKVVAMQLGVDTGWLQALYQAEQVSGVWLAVLLFAAWSGRHHWRAMWHGLWRGETAAARVEPFGVRTWAALAVVGWAGMIVFGARSGMSAGFAAAYFTVYLGFSLALTRMRAEFGPPCHDLFGAGPDRTFITWLGGRGIAPRNLASTAVFYWLSRESPRSHPMPPQLESLFLASGGRLSLARVAPAIWLFGCLSALVTFWAVLHFGYDLGSQAKFRGPATWFASEGFNRLDAWLVSPPEPQAGPRIAMVAAFVLSLLCLVLRTRWLGFGFHPAGYAISSWWAINLLWFPLLIAWATKLVIFRYFGGRAYRHARWFFIGLILGEFVVGSLWQLAAMIWRTTTYAFWI